MGTQSVAMTMTCPLIGEAAFAIGCMLNAFEVPRKPRWPSYLQDRLVLLGLSRGEVEGTV